MLRAGGEALTREGSRRLPKALKKGLEAQVLLFDGERCTLGSLAWRVASVLEG